MNKETLETLIKQVQHELERAQKATCDALKTEEEIGDRLGQLERTFRSITNQGRTRRQWSPGFRRE